MEILFNDRRDAGTQLAQALEKEKIEQKDLVLLALPRGGVPIAAEISRRFRLPYDVLIVRKIGHPHNEEFGIGAITEDGSYWLNPLYLDVNPDIDRMIDRTINREREELKRRIELYREKKPLPELKGKTVMLIDDGLATGVSARLAAEYVKKLGAKEIILAVPVCASATAADLRKKGIIVKSVKEISRFSAVGEHYLVFGQVQDQEVIRELRAVHKAFPSDDHHQS